MATSAETVLDTNAQTILKKRYLRKDANKNIIETPDELFDRVSYGYEEARELMTRLDFLPNSPTLFNGGIYGEDGKQLGTNSACFKFDVPDNMPGIMDVAKKAAMVLKYGGGVGYALSDLRPKGSSVNSTHGVASGPVGFMPIYQAVAKTVTQSGKRDAAQMAILHCDHPDVREFIHCKDTEEKAEQFNTFNISVAATDEFMERWSDEPREDGNLLWEMAKGAWATGDPGCYFIDTAERGNPTPWAGLLTGTNPCGEVPLLNNEPCNLGSINLCHHIAIHLHEVDWIKLEHTTRVATRYLDLVLDNNVFPHEDITRAAFYTRKLGLGVMGWADMLAKLGIHYDSWEAVELAEEIMSKINAWSFAESAKMAIEKGVAPCFKDEPAAEGRGINQLRNATRTCIAPTGTISQLASASYGIEPHMFLEFTHTMGDGTVLQKEAGNFGGFVPHLSNDIAWEWHVRHQAAFQKHTDLAVSKTINMAESVTVDDIFNAYVEAWRAGCKGITVYRNNCRSKQVISVSSSIGAEASFNINESKSNGHVALENVHFHGRKKLPHTRPSITHKFEIGGQDFYFTVGLYSDGQPGELFIKAAKEGSTISGLLDSFAIAISHGLQHGVPLEILSRKFIGVNFEPHGFTDNPEIPNSTSVVDYIFRWMRKNYIKDNEPVQIYSGVLCPECGKPALMVEGCEVCSAGCGWAAC